VTIFQKQGGLFIHQVALPGGTAFVQTVEENLAMYTPHQILKARAARELCAMVGRPSLADFVGMMKHNLLPNVKVTAQDVLNAEAIYGKDLGAIQGKTTRSQPVAVIPDYVNIPPDLLIVHKQVTLCIDIMYINDIPFLISVSRNIQFTTIERLENRKEVTLNLSIRKVCKLYQRRGFVIGDMCFMDNEFEVLRGDLLLHEIALNTCAPGKHVPEIERRIRTVKERVRGLVHTIPFQKIPTIMIVHIAVFSVMWLNFFPPKGGISPTLSPQTILTQIRIDHDKHCWLLFGAYAQVHAEHTPTNNAMESRTVGGVSLGPTGNIQGSYNFLSLLTGHRIKARSFTPLPMPADVIAAVESFAPTNAVRDPVFQDRNGRMEWQTDVDDPEEYHDAQEFVPPEEQNDDDVPFRYDEAILAAERDDLASDATAHGELPGVDTDDETDKGPTDTEAPSVDDDEIPGVQDANPGVTDADPGVSDADPGVQAAIAGVEQDNKNNNEEEIGEHNTEQYDDDEEEIVFGTDSGSDSEYKPSHQASDDDANTDEDGKKDDDAEHTHSLFDPTFFAFACLSKFSNFTSRRSLLTILILLRKRLSF
jgi:hypothetical protein